MQAPFSCDDILDEHSKHDGVGVVFQRSSVLISCRQSSQKVTEVKEVRKVCEQQTTVVGL